MMLLFSLFHSIPGCLYFIYLCILSISKVAPDVKVISVFLETNLCQRYLSKHTRNMRLARCIADVLPIYSPPI